MPEIPTFFNTVKKKTKGKKDLIVGDQNRRKTILLYLSRREPMSAYEVERNIEMARGSAYKIVDSFARSGLLVCPADEPHGRNIYRRYTLTDEGYSVGLAVAYDEKGKDQNIGKRYEDLLRKVNVPDLRLDPLSNFGARVLTLAIDRGLSNYVMRFMRNSIRELELVRDFTDWRRLGMVGAEAFAGEFDAISECEISAFADMSDEDRQIVVSFFKNQAVQVVYNLGMKSRSRELQLLASKSQLDPNGVYMPFKCRNCDYGKAATYWTNVQLIHMFFVSSMECPKCHVISSLSRPGLAAIKKVGQNQIISRTANHR
jgi:DNA-binding PadR family transcriptional regulator